MTIILRKNHARAASGTGALTLCGSGDRTDSAYPVDCPMCLEIMLEHIEEVGRKRKVKTTDAYSAGYRAGWNDALFVIEKHCKDSKKP